MAQMSVEQFAHELGMMPSVLLEQLQAAGVNKVFAEDNLTEQDKAQLLDYLRKTHGVKQIKDKVTLTRRQTSEIRKSDSMGRARTIQVVRKRRVLTKSPFDNKAERQLSESEGVEKLHKAEPVIDAEELALREAEAKKQAELIARQVAEIQRKKLRKIEAEKIERTKLVVSVEEKETEIRKEKTGVDTITVSTEAFAKQAEGAQVNMAVQAESDQISIHEATELRQQEQTNTESKRPAESRSKELQTTDANKNIANVTKKIEKPEKPTKPTRKRNKLNKPLGLMKECASVVRKYVKSFQQDRDGVDGGISNRNLSK